MKNVFIFFFYYTMTFTSAFAGTDTELILQPIPHSYFLCSNSYLHSPGSYGMSHRLTNVHYENGVIEFDVENIFVICRSSFGLNPILHEEIIEPVKGYIGHHWEQSEAKIKQNWKTIKKDDDLNNSIVSLLSFQFQDDSPRPVKVHLDYHVTSESRIASDGTTIFSKFRVALDKMLTVKNIQDLKSGIQVRVVAELGTWFATSTYFENKRYDSELGGPYGRNIHFIIKPIKSQSGKVTYSVRLN